MKIHHPQQTDVQGAELQRTISDKDKKTQNKTSPVSLVLSYTNNLHRPEQKQHEQVFLACNLCKNTLCKAVPFINSYFSLVLTM